MKLKMVNMKDAVWILSDWLGMQPHRSSEAIAKHLPFAEREKFNAIIWPENRFEGSIPIKVARTYLRAMRAALKGIGRYGGVPAKLAKEREALQDAIEELACAIKNPE